MRFDDASSVSATSYVPRRLIFAMIKLFALLVKALTSLFMETVPTNG